MGTTAALALLRGAPAVAQEAMPFGRPSVIELAFQLAATEFVPPAPPVPAVLRNLAFGDYQALRARETAWLFAEPPSGFAVEPLHSGFIYRDPVELFQIIDQRAVKIPFSAEDFDYPQVEGLPPDPVGLEFAGFQGRTEMNAPGKLDPFVVFAGASYFQAVARGQVFGLSARGLSINTGEAAGEEFPLFRTFWLETPTDGRMVVHALLDSPSVTGAYRFTIRPGDETQIDVEVTLFTRAALDRIGFAPLTSMFLFNQRERGQFDDSRTGVHESDGLAIWNGKDERIWRPLHNPRLLQISAFADTGPRGFGLIQREKRFSEYEDIENRFDRRPSLWVEPIGDWGPGSVVLVELPSTREINDNIVAFWRPEVPLAAGSQTTLTYRLTWGWDAPLAESGLMRVTRTLTGASQRDGWRRFEIDFSNGGAVSVVGIEVRALSSGGVIDSVTLKENSGSGGLRVSLELNPDGLDSADLRVELRRGGTAVAEVWVYRWSQ